MDFATDAFATGRRFRTFNLMDGFDREALEMEVDTSLEEDAVDAVDRSLDTLAFTRVGSEKPARER